MLPDAFERTLKLRDQQLSLRYGKETKCWIIERKERIGKAEFDFLYFAARRPKPDVKAVESWESARVGKRIVFYVDTLDNRLLDKIDLQDVQKHGMEVFDRTIKEGNRLKRAQKAVAHEKARIAADAMYHIINKHSSAVEHGGKGDMLMADALGTESQVRRQHYMPLLDAYGRTSAPKDVKIQLAR